MFQAWYCLPSDTQASVYHTELQWEHLRPGSSVYSTPLDLGRVATSLTKGGLMFRGPYSTRTFPPHLVGPAWTFPYLALYCFQMCMVSFRWSRATVATAEGEPTPYRI